MLKCAEQVQIQIYKTHAYKRLKTAGVQIIMLEHPTKHEKNMHKNPYTVSTYTKTTPTIQTNDDRQTDTQTHAHTVYIARLICSFYLSGSKCTYLRRSVPEIR